jgi:hypothetical protein
MDSQLIEAILPPFRATPMTNYSEESRVLWERERGFNECRDEVRANLEVHLARLVLRDDAVIGLVRACNYALAQHNAPHMFRPESNHWSAALSNALANVSALEPQA